MIKKIANYMEKIQLFMGVICLSAFFITILIQIFSRYFGISVIWTEEVANYSFIWSVFMGASVMLHRKGHFKFNLLLLKLEGKAKIFLNLVINTILLIFSSLVLYYGVIATRSFWYYRWVALPDLQMGYVFLCLPIMGLTMGTYVLSHMTDQIKEWKGGN